MRTFILAITALFIWSVPVFAENAPGTSSDASSTSSQESSKFTLSTTNRSNPKLQMKVGLGGGYPEIIGASLAFSSANRFEFEMSGGGLLTTGTASLRAGYPWVIAGLKRPGWWFSMIPKAGLRWIYSELLFPTGLGCGSGGGSISRGDEVNAIGINAVASIEVGYISKKRFGVFFQLTAGTTLLFAGTNESVTYSCQDTETTRTAKDNSPWSPDFRGMITLTF